MMKFHNMILGVVGEVSGDAGLHVIITLLELSSSSLITSHLTLTAS